MIALHEQTFRVGGMSCASCVGRIEKGLRALEGVAEVQVSVALERVTVTHDATVQREKIEQEIEKIGYTVVSSQQNTPDSSPLRPSFFRIHLSLLWAGGCMLLLMAGMGMHMVGGDHATWGVLALLMNPWVQLIVAAPVQFGIGRVFYIGAYQALRQGTATMDVLLAVATTVIYGYSIFQAIYFASTPVHLYVETSVMLIFFVVVGKKLEQRIKEQATVTVRSLLHMQEHPVTVYRDGNTLSVFMQDILVDDLVVVAPGAWIAVDGTVTAGASTVDEAMLTGESEPVVRGVGDAVYAGTLNQQGMLTVRATTSGQNTVLTRMVQLTTEAQQQKAPIQRVADRVASVFVPSIFGLSLLTFFVTYMLGDFENVSMALERAIAVLVIACPCALGLATPLSLLVGFGRAVSVGVLFRGPAQLEALSHSDTIVLDKTGTLTTGMFTCTHILPIDCDEIDLIRWVSSAQQEANHPIAESMRRLAQEKSLSLMPCHSLQTIAGCGIQATIDSKTVRIGTTRWLAATPLLAEYQHKLFEWERTGFTVMVVTIDDTLAGLLSLADRPREEAHTVIAQLQKRMSVHMLTGDREGTAMRVAHTLGISHVTAGVFPHQKAAYIQQLQKQGKRVAMVGDGMNDAPALATADVGIAMYRGADAAKEAADVTLLRTDLHAIVDAFAVSRLTWRNVKQNLFWAIAFNGIGIPLAMGGLFTPWMAAAAMAMSALMVVLNALRLRRMPLVRQ